MPEQSESDNDPTTNQDIVRAMTMRETEKAEFLFIVRYNDEEIGPIKSWMPKAWFEERTTISNKLDDIVMVEWASRKGFVKDRIDEGIKVDQTKKKKNVLSEDKRTNELRTLYQERKQILTEIDKIHEEIADNLTLLEKRKKVVNKALYKLISKERKVVKETTEDQDMTITLDDRTQLRIILKHNSKTIMRNKSDLIEEFGEQVTRERRFVTTRYEEILVE
ncbi:MAG: hypothetical protein HeimC2_21700 [Candidatus Heimdallarchaeota archaeon LC_2]|nr:MAG: hypothetical protein HeimC2_21700 [Candidatus Heimdallarchaeota archaeon LC_2]